MMEKLKYSISYSDVSEMEPGARDVIELFEDGKLLIKRYAPGSRFFEAKNLCATIRVCVYVYVRVAL